MSATQIVYKLTSPFESDFQVGHVFAKILHESDAQWSM